MRGALGLYSRGNCGSLVCSRHQRVTVQISTRRKGLKRTHCPHANRSGRVCVGGPGLYDPTPPVGGPCLGQRWSTSVGADSPWHTGTQSVLHSMARGPGGTHGWSYPQRSRLVGPAGTQCSNQPGAGPAGPRRRQAYLWERDRQKEKTAGKAGSARQRVGQGCCWQSQRRAESERGHSTNGGDRWWRNWGRFSQSVRSLEIRITLQFCTDLYHSTHHWH